jgi:hypothetical protein
MLLQIANEIIIMIITTIKISNIKIKLQQTTKNIILLLFYLFLPNVFDYHLFYWTKSIKNLFDFQACAMYLNCMCFEWAERGYKQLK